MKRLLFIVTDSCRRICILSDSQIQLMTFSISIQAVKGFTTVYISSRMFSLIAQADLDDEELQEIMNNLKSIRILTVDEVLWSRT